MYFTAIGKNSHSFLSTWLSGSVHHSYLILGLRSHFRINLQSRTSACLKDSACFISDLSGMFSGSPEMSHKKTHNPECVFQESLHTESLVHDPRGAQFSSCPHQKGGNHPGLSRSGPLWVSSTERPRGPGELPGQPFLNSRATWLWDTVGEWWLH